MRYTQYFVPTMREIPSEAETISHKLMLRAGLIRKITSGIYTYLPLGLKIIHKVENIVRTEMNKAGAIELLMPAVQPGELWMESGRWEFYGKELLRFSDRHNRDYCFGPTHEEVITDIARRELHSHKQLPINFYQIQTKFRDEIRPRFGLMRGREFIMKDAYSFDADDVGAEESYRKMFNAYNRIFKRCGLKFCGVEADSGTIGGSFSHEFMVFAQTGEDEIVACSSCGYAANLERAEIAGNTVTCDMQNINLPDMEKVHTPNIKTIDDIATFMGKQTEDILKTIILISDGEPVAALVRGDHDINMAKLKTLLGAGVLELADHETVERITGAPVGFAGPIGLNIKIIADRSVQNMSGMVVGGNEKDIHLKNVFLKDFKVNEFADIRIINSKDVCPRCGGLIDFIRGIEVGHIFKLGTKYSKSMKANFLNENGEESPFVMGCYGIGIGRTVAAAIEQHNDENGIIWPVSIAPFQIIILPLQVHQSEVMEVAEKLYKELTDKGMEVLIDDRDERAGVKFNDADLLGIPVRLTIGSRGVKEGIVELKMRWEQESQNVSVEQVVPMIYDKIRESDDQA